MYLVFSCPRLHGTSRASHQARDLRPAPRVTYSEFVAPTAFGWGQSASGTGLVLGFCAHDKCISSVGSWLSDSTEDINDRLGRMQKCGKFPPPSVDWNISRQGSQATGCDRRQQAFGAEERCSTRGLHVPMNYARASAQGRKANTRSCTIRAADREGWRGKQTERWPKTMPINFFGKSQALMPQSIATKSNVLKPPLASWNSPEDAAQQSWLWFIISVSPCGEGSLEASTTWCTERHFRRRSVRYKVAIHSRLFSRILSHLLSSFAQVGMSGGNG